MLSENFCRVWRFIHKCFWCCGVQKRRCRKAHLQHLRKIKLVVSTQNSFAQKSLLKQSSAFARLFVSCCISRCLGFCLQPWPTFCSSLPKNRHCDAHRWPAVLKIFNFRFVCSSPPVLFVSTIRICQQAERPNTKNNKSASNVTLLRIEKNFDHQKICVCCFSLACGAEL